MPENSIKFLNDLTQDIEDLERELKELEKDIKYLNIKNNTKNQLISQMVNDYILKED